MGRPLPVLAEIMLRGKRLLPTMHTFFAMVEYTLVALGTWTDAKSQRGKGRKFCENNIRFRAK